jgi:hypothetical protein
MPRLILSAILLCLAATPALALRALPIPQTACTEEAKICPDGSSVGRTGPECHFAPCPGEAGVSEDSEGQSGEGESSEAVPQRPPAGKPGSPRYIPRDQEQIACPMDAKICPDGTGVSRTGPNCEFAPCPGDEPPAEEEDPVDPIEDGDE